MRITWECSISKSDLFWGRAALIHFNVITTGLHSSHLAAAAALLHATLIVHGHFAAGVPEPLPVRLSGGTSPDEGRIEILWQGTWGVLSGAISPLEADVVCQQLGYVYGGIVAPAGTFAATSSAMLHWNATLSCSGSEASLLECVDAAEPSIRVAHAGVFCRRSAGEGTVISAGGGPILQVAVSAQCGVTAARP